jgi:hypothetical protein
MPIPSQASKEEGVETGWATPKGPWSYGEGTVQTTNAEGGGESRSGMNPGAVGSNPAADTILDSAWPARISGLAASLKPSKHPSCDQIIGALDRTRRGQRWRLCYSIRVPEALLIGLSVLTEATGQPRRPFERLSYGWLHMSNSPVAEPLINARRDSA